MTTSVGVLINHTVPMQLMQGTKSTVPKMKLGGTTKFKGGKTYKNVLTGVTPISGTSAGTSKPVHPMRPKPPKPTVLGVTLGGTDESSTIHTVMTTIVKVFATKFMLNLEQRVPQDYLKDKY